ncbi:AfsR/SARP family transcriptional regulator [Promicromonospora sukumoe]|uniref:AfsR/SARP family transcriptional regulator n=1 Tax=Promicromonospora sukumoe TaxID=88382 RepID=UPI00036FA75B|nr:BTAD domain-containing putative transcriptional regulator [Promicromonospora sukumoe]
MDDGERPAVTVALLGPFAVEVDDEPVRLPDRLRSLLAGLAVGRGEPVTVERLVDVVWGEDLPAAPQRSLQVLVRRLRTALGDAAVETVPGGYRLAVPAERVDAAVFADLVQARPGEAPAAERRRLVAALRLWRGPAFDGVASAALHAVEGPRLDEQRLTALARRIELDLAAGEGAGDGAGDDAGDDAGDGSGDTTDQQVTELQDLTRRHPLQERFWAQLMTALVRGGRRAEALDAYASLERTLADELGIGPGEAVRRLHREITQGQITQGQITQGESTQPGLVPRQLPLAPRAFSGRADALAGLDDLLADDAAPRVALLDGAGGVGKTATALHWAHRVADRFPDGQLYANLRGFDPASAPVPAATVVRGFLDALGVAKGRVPASEEAQLALYRGVVAGRRLLVVLDNARDAGQVGPLLPGPGASVTVVTSRATLSGLAPAQDLRRVALGTLTPGEGFDLLALRVGAERTDAEPEAARRIVARCAGLPLAIVIAAARVLARPAFPLSAVADELADGGARLDALGDDDAMADVRSVFATSYRALSPDGARLFRLLGTHPGPDVSREATRALAAEPDTGGDAADAALAELARVNLVTEHAAGRYAMHDLVAEYARERARLDEPPEQRDAALRRLTRWYLGVALEMDRRRWPARVPQAFVADPGAAPGPVDVPDQEPAAWFRAEGAVLLAVVDAAARTQGLDAEAVSLVWAVYSTLSYHADLRDALWSGLVTARDVALRTGDRPAELWCLRYLAAMAAVAGRTAQGEDLRRRTVDLATELDDPRALQMAHQGYAGDLVRWGRSADAVGQAEQALVHGRRTGEAYYEAHALNILAWALAHDGDLARALPLAEQALALLNDADNPTTRAVVWDTLGLLHARLGDPERAITCYQEAAVRFREFDMRQDLVAAERRRAGLLGDVGRWTQARDAWQECLDQHLELGLGGVAAVREALAHAAARAAAQTTGNA